MANFATGSFPNYLDGLADHANAGLANLRKKSLYQKWMRVEDAKRLTEIKLDIENMGEASAWNEGAPRPEMSFSEGFSKSFTQQMYGGLADITKLMLKFDQVGLYRQIMQQLMLSTYKSREIIATAYLENGDTALASVPIVAGKPIIQSVGGDNVTLFNASHAWKSAGHTYRNIASTFVDLTETGINTQYVHIRRWTDSSNFPLDVNLSGIIFPPDQHSDAMKAMKSRLEHQTANNAINVASLQVKGDMLMENNLLTSTTDWYIKTDAKDAELYWFSGWDDEVKTRQYNPRTGNECTTIDYSAAHGGCRVLSLFKVT